MEEADTSQTGRMFGWCLLESRAEQFACWLLQLASCGLFVFGKLRVMFALLPST